MGDELERHEKCHMDMVKAEADRMGEGEDDGKSEEEKALADFIAKSGRAISAKNKEKIKSIIKMIEDGHTEHGKAVEQVTAALKAIMASGDGGEETKPDEKSGDAPELKVEHLGSKSELETYLFTQRLARQVKTTAEGVLSARSSRKDQGTSRTRPLDLSPNNSTMNEDKILAAVSETTAKTFTDMMEKSLAKMEEVSAKTARRIVDEMSVERAIKGTDITFLSDDQKKDFSLQVIEAFKGHESKAVRVTKELVDAGKVTLKANEALIEEQDNRGGYLVQPEVAAAILRIAASVGTILKQAQRWNMKTDQLGIPNYTGSFLTGSYVGVDLPGNITGLTFGQAVLVVKKWQLAFAVGNDLLRDASVELGDWLLSLAGEALANMVDQQGLVGGATINGSTAGTSTSYAGPFQGVLGLPAGATNTYTMSSGNTTYAKFNPVTDALNMVATLEESVLDGCAFVCHRTVWADIAGMIASTSGLPFLYFGAMTGNQSGLEKDPLGGPIRAAGYMAGFPVYTNRWMPATTIATQANTPFIIFGNLKAMAFGDKGTIRVGNFASGSFGGKEIALSDQSGIVYKHDHALVVVLTKAFCVGFTSAS